MNEINDGGPAFPILDHSDGRLVLREYGMSMRDYFAARAMAGIIAGIGYEGNIRCPDAQIASAAYSMADAMLARRSRP